MHVITLDGGHVTIAVCSTFITGLCIEITAGIMVADVTGLPGAADIVVADVTELPGAARWPI